MARGVAVAGNFRPVMRLQGDGAADAEGGAVADDALADDGNKLSFGKGIDLPVQRAGAVAVHAGACVDTGTKVNDGRHIRQGGVANVETVLLVLQLHNTLLHGSATFYNGRPKRRASIRRRNSSMIWR